MAALSVFRSQSFYFLAKKQKGFPLKPGCRFNIKTQFCHSVGNLTKWFDEVNLSGLDSYGMTKETLKNK